MRLNCVCSWCVIAIMAAGAGVTRADGCILSKLGVYVPERAQFAFVEWSNGSERLFVSTQAVPHAGPTVWLVPIPAPPDKIVVDPISTFPIVFGDELVIEKAKNFLMMTTVATAVLDILPMAPMIIAATAIGTQASTTFSNVATSLDGGVIVHQHIEKLGMTVEVVTAESPKALNDYLHRHGFETDAERIEAIRPYIEGPYSLICGWLTDPARVEARSLRVDFPSPEIFYPLRPTSVYRTPVDAVVYVRGWAMPAQNSGQMPRCRYLRGRVTDMPVSTLGENHLWKNIDYRLPEEKLTRIEIGRQASMWTEDLRLAVGAPSAVAVADRIGAMSYGFAMLLQIVVGAAAGCVVPLLTVEDNSKRKLCDLGWGMVAGGLSCFSIVATWLVARYWQRKSWRPLSEGDEEPFGEWLRPGIIVTAVMAVFVAAGLAANLVIPPLLLVVILIAIGLLSFPDIPKLFDPRFVDRKSLVGPLTIFAALHTGTIFVLCTLIENWLHRST